MSPPDNLDVPQWNELATRWQALGQEWAQFWQRAGLPIATGAIISDASARHNANGTPVFDPGAVAQLSERFAPRIQALWARVLGESTAPSTDADARTKADRRFAAPAWREQPYFAFIKEAYLLYAEYLSELASLAKLAPADKQRFVFATRQYLDAIAPTNYPATNPEVLGRALETDGASLLHGLANLITDAQKGRITMSDERAFQVGRNLAVTPGRVVFRNDLMELIQYDATTPTVHQRPLVIVPPCINKFYILDMRPENSFVRHAVAQGHTVFMISWRNVPPALGQVTWDDYLTDGVLKAFDVARDIVSTRTLNTLGFCVGGTMLACALAILASRGDRSVATATYLTTMLDFADPGAIAVYISRESLAAELPKHGIAYVHMPELGGRRAPAKDSPNDALRNAQFRGYADYMGTREFAEAVERLIELDGPVAIMCAEAVPWRCHRSLVADALNARGIPVMEILSRTSYRPHKLTPFARVQGTRVTYPPEQGALF